MHIVERSWVEDERRAVATSVNDTSRAREGTTMHLRGFATVNIWADDVPAAVDWYAQVLGVEAYFQRPGPDGTPVYAEFRVGDFEAELGIIDRRFAPAGASSEPGGAIIYWHVDDLKATVEDLLALGAKEFEPITPAGRPRLRDRISRGSVRQSAGRHVQPALRRDPRVHRAGLTTAVAVS